MAKYRLTYKEFGQMGWEKQGHLSFVGDDIESVKAEVEAWIKYNNEHSQYTYKPIRLMQEVYIWQH